MNTIQSSSRQQMEMGYLEDSVAHDNAVRVLDLFVDKLYLGRLGFKIAEVKPEGRPGFLPQVFLKLYLYGYINGVRSSRKLERECVRNVEVHWLLGSQRWPR